MKLCARVVGDDNVSELGRYDSDDLDGLPAFQVVDGSVPAGYEDISSITNWDRYGYGVGKDYKVIRNEIITLANADWNALSTEEKTIAAKYFAVDVAKRDEIFSTDQQVKLGLAYHMCSMDSRRARWAHASMEVFNRLSSAEVDEVVEDLVADDLEFKYISRGREGTEVGDPEGIYDYVQSKAGTKWASTGLSSKGYTPIGMSLTQLCDRVMEILRDGNY